MNKNSIIFLYSIILGIFSSQTFPNQQIIQEVLDGGTIPKFVEPVPLFNKNRADGRKKLIIKAEEFQQKLLPKSFYKKLPKSVTYKRVDNGESLFTINPRKGTYQW